MNNSSNIALLSPAVGTPNVGDSFIETAIRRLLRDDVDFQRFSIRRPLEQREIDAINECACALICGTNLYQHDWHSALTPAVIERFKVPVIPFGVGSSAASLGDIGVSDMTRQMIQIMHSRCALGSVRDPHSALVVGSSGVTNFVTTGCPVLFWSGRETLPMIQPLKRHRIVVTARNWLMHRWPDNVDHPVQIHFLRAILEHFPDDQVVFAVHEEWDDRLVDLIPIPRHLVFRSNDPEDYVRLYTNPANIVLAMRLHAGMLALANGVPAVFVGHDTRTYSFCEMMDVEYVDLFATSCADECIKRLQQILDGDLSSLVGTHSRYQQLCAAMRRFLTANSLPVRESAVQVRSHVGVA